MRRRLFLSAAVCVLAHTLVPQDASAAQPDQKIVRLGFVAAESPATVSKGVTAFWDRLRELGYVEGQNLVL